MWSTYQPIESYGIIQLGDHGAHFESPGLSLGLASSVPLHRIAGGVVTDFTLGEGESVTFVLRRLADERAMTRCPRVEQAEGLSSEQTGASGEALGNFPLAFTHLALISAAFNLDRALDQSHQAVAHELAMT